VRNSIAILLIAVAMVLLMSPTGASAAVQTDRYSFSGDVLAAYSLTSTACSSGSTSVEAAETTDRVSGDVEQQSFAYYYSEVHDFCAGTVTYSFGSAEPTTFEKTAMSGSFTATIPITTAVYDSNTDALLSESQSIVSLDLTFTASGPPTTQSYTSRFGEPGVFLYTSKSRGSFSGATVTGTPDLEWNYASIGTARFGTVTVTHY
jgi:hypothetical protein